MNASFTVWQSPEGAHVRADFNTLVQAEIAALQFAAVPELLAALSTLTVEVEMLEMMGETGNTASRANVDAALAAARAAIAKAKGEA